MSDLTYKQIARMEQIHISTVYRRYPVIKPEATQSQVVILHLHGYSIREIAETLVISKNREWRLLHGI